MPEEATHPETQEAIGFADSPEVTEAFPGQLPFLISYPVSPKVHLSDDVLCFGVWETHFLLPSAIRPDRPGCVTFVMFSQPL